MPKIEKLTEALLRDREEHRMRAQQSRSRRERIAGDDLDAFNVQWVSPTGAAGYLPKPMRRGKEGFVINCRACGTKFDSKGWAYCSACMELPSETRHEMVPAGRACEAPGCTNVIAGTARADARYCSTACRKRASRDKNDDMVPDIPPPENVTLNREKSEQKQGAKNDTDESAAFARLQGDAVRSNWEPTGDGEDMPDIPEFLRRR
jgi:hypothetical protein